METNEEMSKTGPLKAFLSQFSLKNDLIRYSSTGGYWSNLSKDQNDELLSQIDKGSCDETVQNLFPKLYDVIFSSKRSAGLGLLELKGHEVGVDLGCMWGALSVPLAKRIRHVLAVDQTYESLLFLKKRSSEEKIRNLSLLHANLRELELPEKVFDIVLINGVLEWIPEVENIVVDEYWYGRGHRDSVSNPMKMQKDFLKKVHTTLNVDGKVMLAIENRYDYKMFFGVRDPHVGLPFTTILPRFAANFISKIIRSRPYLPWIYSFEDTKNLLLESGFSSVKLFSVWPDYRFPDHITPYKSRNPYFKPISIRKDGKIQLKRLIANRIEMILFKLFNIQFVAPSIIAIAQK